MGDHPGLGQEVQVVNVNSGKALDITGAVTTDGAPLMQKTYSGTATQLWSFTSLMDQGGNYQVGPTSKTGSSLTPVLGAATDGTAIQQTTFNTADFEKWTILPG